MSIRMISLSISPEEVLELLIGEANGDLIHHEYYQLQENKGWGYVVFEGFYSEKNDQRMLIVHTENIKGVTNATIITSSNFEEWRFQLDWEEKDSFMDEVMALFDEYILDEKEP